MELSPPPCFVLFFFINLKKPEENRKEKIKYNLNLLLYCEACLWGFQWDLWMQWLAPAPFDRFALSLGPAPSCSLGTGVSDELLKSCTQPFVILVQFKKQSTRNEGIKEPKRLWNMDTKLIIFVSFTPATSQTNSYFREM